MCPKLPRQQYFDLYEKNPCRKGNPIPLLLETLEKLFFSLIKVSFIQSSGKPEQGTIAAFVNLTYSNKITD